eukprot:400303_1
MGSCFATISNKELLPISSEKIKYTVSNCLISLSEDIVDTIMEYVPIYDNVLRKIKHANLQDNYLIFGHHKALEFQALNKEYTQFQRNKKQLDNTNHNVTREYKIVVHGSNGCGKSSLTIQLVVSKFIGDVMPDWNIDSDDSYRFTTIINSKIVLLDILDLSGYDCPIRDSWIRVGLIHLLCFDINDMESWNNIERIRSMLMSYEDNKIFVLVSTKCDLKTTNQSVSHHQIIEKAKEWNCPYIETSAKRNKNVSFAFHHAVCEYMYQHDTN